MPIDDTRIVEVYSFEFVKNFGHLIGVKGGDSGGKSVSRCDPAESERGGTRTTRGKRRPVTEIDRISVFRIFMFTPGLMKFEIDSLNIKKELPLVIFYDF